MSGEYRTIVADPPWTVEKKMRAGGRRARDTEVPYEFMSIEEIEALPVVDLAAWSPGPYLELFARRARFGWDYWGDQSLGTAEMPEAAA